MDYSTIDIFQKVASDKLNRLSMNPIRPFNNLTSGEIQALLRLEKNNLLVIKPSDKGGNLVIMDHSIYKTMARTYCVMETHTEFLMGIHLEHLSLN